MRYKGQALFGLTINYSYNWIRNHIFGFIVKHGMIRNELSNFDSRSVICRSPLGGNNNRCRVEYEAGALVSGARERPLLVPGTGSYAPECSHFPDPFVYLLREQAGSFGRNFLFLASTRAGSMHGLVAFYTYFLFSNQCCIMRCSLQNDIGVILSNVVGLLMSSESLQ